VLPTVLALAGVSHRTADRPKRYTLVMDTLIAIVAFLVIMVFVGIALDSIRRG